MRIRPGSGFCVHECGQMDLWHGVSGLEMEDYLPLREIDGGLLHIEQSRGLVSRCRLGIHFSIVCYPLNVLWHSVRRIPMLRALSQEAVGFAKYQLPHLDQMRLATKTLQDATLSNLARFPPFKLPKASTACFRVIRSILSTARPLIEQSIPLKSEADSGSSTCLGQTLFLAHLALPLRPQREFQQKLRRFRDDTPNDPRQIARRQLLVTAQSTLSISSPSRD